MFPCFHIPSQHHNNTVPIAAGSANSNPTTAAALRLGGHPEIVPATPPANSPTKSQGIVNGKEQLSSNSFSADGFFEHIVDLVHLYFYGPLEGEVRVPLTSEETALLNNLGFFSVPCNKKGKGRDLGTFLQLQFLKLKNDLLLLDGVSGSDINQQPSKLQPSTQAVWLAWQSLQKNCADHQNFYTPRQSEYTPQGQGL